MAKINNKVPSTIIIIKTSQEPCSSSLNQSELRMSACSHVGKFLTI